MSETEHRSIASAITAVVLSILIAVAIDQIVVAMGLHERARTKELKVQPSADRIYLLGNSMFKTAIDVEALESHLGGGVGVDFEEHVGHYTNLWYLMVKNALLQTEQRPRMIVWGFRPTYANKPAFRQKQICDVELFATSKDEFYDEMVSNDDASGVAAWRLWMSRHSGLYAGRMKARGVVDDTLQRKMLSLLSLTGGPATPYIEAELTAGASLAEVIARRIDDGRYRMAEEALIDRGKQFVHGPTVSFDKSFVPVIAEMIADSGIPQMVIVFKPVSELSEEPDLDARAFAEDAERYFASQGIPIVNFVNDERIQFDHYASGDHYNESGRQLVTELLGEALRGLDPVSENPGAQVASRDPS